MFVVDILCSSTVKTEFRSRLVYVLYYPFIFIGDSILMLKLKLVDIQAFVFSVIYWGFNLHVNQLKLSILKLVYLKFSVAVY